MNAAAKGKPYPQGDHIRFYFALLPKNTSQNFRDFFSLKYGIQKVSLLKVGMEHTPLRTNRQIGPNVIVVEDYFEGMQN